jgi:hypothetical protein
MLSNETRGVPRVNDPRFLFRGRTCVSLRL